jgi:glycosyltransferase involved in cell wall biosynthesis
MPRRLLYILHQYSHLGGSELQTRLLAQRLSGTYHVAVAWMDVTAKCAVLQDVQSGVQTRWPTEPVMRSPGDESVPEQTLRDVLRAFGPDIVHVQQILFWPLSAIDIALASGAKIVVSLYDYVTITPDYAMYGVSDPRETFTPAYAVSRFGSDTSAFLAHRRQHLGRSLARVHRRVVISEYLRRVVSLVHPLEFQVIEPGIEPFQPLPKIPSAGGLRFGFLGSFIRAKGMVTLSQAFLKLRQRHPGAQLRIYGGPVPRGSPPPGMSIPGPYSPGELPGIFGEFDVGVIPSIFAETYSIVLSEMWHARTPVVASRIGAMAERITDGVNGKLVPPEDSDALAAAMAWYTENDSWRHWKMPPVRTADQLATEHAEMYEELFR